MFAPKRSKFKDNKKIGSVACRSAFRFAPQQSQDYQLLKRTYTINDQIDNRREIAMRLYMENDFTSVRHSFYDNDYEGPFSVRMNTALISLLKHSKALNVRSPEIPSVITPPEYTEYASTRIDMYSEANVVAIEQKKRIFLINSLAPEAEPSAPFLKEDHVSANFIHRPSFILEEENSELDE